jgi:hypothetical protein
LVIVTGVGAQLCARSRTLNPARGGFPLPLGIDVPKLNAVRF